jgi:hypothetical protein
MSHQNIDGSADDWWVGMSCLGYKLVMDGHVMFGVQSAGWVVGWLGAWYKQSASEVTTQHLEHWMKGATLHVDLNILRGEG